MPVWLALTFVTMGLWALWGFFSKVATTHLDGLSAAAWQGVGGALVSLFLFGLLRFQDARMGGSVGGVVIAALAGIASWAGIATFVLALASGGKAAVVVPLAALYPVLTVGLSLVFLKESLTPTQALGIVLAVAAGVLLTRQ